MNAPDMTSVSARTSAARIGRTVATSSFASGSRARLNAACARRRSCRRSTEPTASVNARRARRAPSRSEARRVLCRRGGVDSRRRRARAPRAAPRARPLPSAPGARTKVLSHRCSPLLAFFFVASSDYRSPPGARRGENIARYLVVDAKKR